MSLRQQAEIFPLFAYDLYQLSIIIVSYFDIFVNEEKPSRCPTLHSICSLGTITFNTDLVRVTLGEIRAKAG